MNWDEVRFNETLILELKFIAQKIWKKLLLKVGHNQQSSYIVCLKNNWLSNAINWEEQLSRELPKNSSKCICPLRIKCSRYTWEILGSPFYMSFPLLLFSHVIHPLYIFLNLLSKFWTFVTLTLSLDDFRKTRLTLIKGIENLKKNLKFVVE